MTISSRQDHGPDLEPGRRLPRPAAEFTWRGFAFHELTQVPRRPPERDGEQVGDDPRLGPLSISLAGSHNALLGSGEPMPSLVSAWVRTRPAGRIHILLGGRPCFPPALPRAAAADGGDVRRGQDGLPADRRDGTRDNRARLQRQPRPVLFPPGAAAADVAARSVVAQLDQFSWWVPCAGRPDALWAPAQSGQDRPATRRGSFDRHAAALRIPFAWLVVAEPLPPAELAPELDRLTSQILPLSRGEVGETRRVALERRQAYHRELSRAQVGGAWRIRVLVGGHEPGVTATAAAMLCAAAELDGLPYTLAPAGPPAAFAAAVHANTADLHGGRSAFPAGTELLAALTRPPERELPGIRAVEPHTFDVTPDGHPTARPTETNGAPTLPAGTNGGIGRSAETNGVPGRPAGTNGAPSRHARADGGTGRPGDLRLGVILDDSRHEVGDLLLPRTSLNRHTFVCGATGAGKSQTVRQLLTEASRAGLPWLVIEPAKAEYARMATRVAALGQDVVVIRPGDPDRPPAGFNPLEPAPGFPLQTHVDLLRALFLAAFESHEPFPQILATALVRCYEERGWDLTLGEPAHPRGAPRYPTLADLQRVAAATVTDVGYGDQVAADVGGFIKVRLDSLRLGTTGRFFEGGHPLDFDRLRRRNVVFEIEDVGDDADKAFLMGAVLIRLSEHLRGDERGEATAGRGNRSLRHLTVVEEAHRLLRRSEPGAQGASTQAVEMFAALLAEVRAYGEGIVIAEQIPAKLIPDVIKNTAVKIVHRLPALDDRDSVGATMNLDEAQSRHLVTLVPGEAAVFTDGMDRPLLVRIPPGGDDAERAGVAPVPVSALLGRRSPTCGPVCRTEACTLRQIRGAQHLLAAQRWLTLWAELTVLAHLAGHQAPGADDDLRWAVSADLVDPRILDCAISHAVDGAVEVRTASLQPDTDPAALAAHCVEVMRAVLTGTGAGAVCSADALGYLANPYKWVQVWEALRGGDPDTGRHPATETWERRFRRRIPGATRGEQLAAVDDWRITDMANQRARDAVAFGARRPSAVESAVGATTADPDWADRLAAAVDPFPGAFWAVAGGYFVHADHQPGEDHQ